MGAIENTEHALGGRWLYWFVASTLVAFPIASISLPALPGVINLLIGLLGIYYGIRSGAIVLVKADMLVMNSLIALFAVALFVSILGGLDGEAVKKLGKFFYLLFAIPVYLIFRYVRFNQAFFWYGLVLGALVSGGVALHDIVFGEFRLGYEGRAHGVSHPIIFGDLSMLLGAMALAGIGWFGNKGNRWLKLFPVVAVVMGLLASVFSQARGGWVAIPVLLVIYVWYYSARVSKLKVILAMLGLAVVLVAGYKIPHTGVASKLVTTYSNLERYFISDIDDVSRATSIGSRLEMWQASWQIFLENPLLGVGWGNYQENALALVNAGMRNPSAADWPHPHNQFLSSLVSGGVIGIVATLAIFFLPALVFFRVLNMSNETEDAKRMALVGLILVVSFAIFNLSESFLERSRTSGFLVFYLAACLAGVRNYGFNKGQS